MLPQGMFTFKQPEINYGICSHQKFFDNEVTNHYFVKTSLHNFLAECSLLNLMTRSIESSEKITGSDLEEIVDVQNQKPRRIAV